MGFRIISRVVGLLVGASCCGCHGVTHDGRPLCDEGEVIVVASDQPASLTARIAIDATHAYWTYGRAVADGIPDHGGVNSAPRTGGEVTVVAAEQYVPTAIALTASDVFWIDDFTRWIMRAPKSGGAPVQVVPATHGTGLRVDEKSVYWLDYDEAGPGVFKAPVAGGDRVRLAVAEGQVQALALDATDVYWSDYVADTFMSRVMKVSIEGGEPTVLYSVQGHSIYEDLAVGPGGVYWTGALGEGADPNGAPNVRVSRIPLAGGEPTTLAEAPGVKQVAVDGANVYFTIRPEDGGPGSVKRLPLSDGSISTVAVDQPGLSALAVHDGAACWLNFGAGGDTGQVVCHEACVN